MYQISRWQIYGTFFCVVIIEALSSNLLWQNAWQPNLILTTLIIFSLLLGKNKGFEIGIVAGFLNDTFFGSHSNTSLVFYALVGYLTGRISIYLYRESFFTVALIFVISKICIFFAWYIQYFFGGGLESMWTPFNQVVISEILLTIILTIPLNYVLQNIYKPSSYI